MINDEANNCYYFAVAYRSEHNSKRKTQVILLMITDGKKSHYLALNDALKYQNIETYPERISKLKHYINKYNWEGIEFPAGPKG